MVGETMVCGPGCPRRMADGGALSSGVVGDGGRRSAGGLMFAGLLSSSASSKSTRSSRGAEVWKRPSGVALGRTLGKCITCSD
jgi:hypothetical protein